MPAAAACAQCGLEARYKCPRCTARTCSSSCAKAHKVAQNCSGERDKTAYVSRESYGYVHLMEDYRFLEEMQRKFQDSKKEAPRPAKRRKIGRDVARDPLLPLKKAAVSSGIKLILLAEGMERRKANKTRLVRRGKETQIDWTVTWGFRTSASVKPSLLAPALQHKATKNAASSPIPELLLRVSAQGKLPTEAKEMLKSGELVSALHAEGTSSLVFLLPVPALAETPSRSAKAVLERIDKRPAPIPTINKTFEPLPQFKKRMIGSIVAHSSLPSKPGVYQPGSSFFSPAQPAVSAKSGPALAPAKRYWQLSSSKPLGVALSGCTVVEWPEIEIWRYEDFERAQRVGYIEIVRRDGDEVSVARPTRPPKTPTPAATPKTDTFAGLMGYGVDSESEEGEVEEVQGTGSLIDLLPHDQ